MERHDALVSGDVRVTYRELDDRCRRLGGLLDAYLRTEPGDCIAVLAENSIPYVDLYMGVPAHGRRVVPLNTRWAEPELRYALVDAGARVLFTDQDPGALTDVLDHVVRIDTGEYDTLLGDARSIAPGTVMPIDVAGLFYTGGTTGQSKGVMLTHGNLHANADAMREIAPVGVDDVFLVMAPMFHAAGTTSVIYCADAGARQVFVTFDPRVVLDTIENERVTHTLAVPTMLAALVEELTVQPRDVSSLRVLLHGAAPIAPALLTRTAAAFPTAELVELYGTTETSPIISARGRPVGCEVRVVNGEILVRGNNVMAGYWRKLDPTLAALEGGWYHTGDVGHIDRTGRLFVLDRKDDMIITGGENVYPSEVESALCSHPAVVEAAVYGIVDGRWGEQVHGAVVVRCPVSEDELVAHCRDRIAGYKVPRSITFLDALPKSGAGKVLKRMLRATR